MTIRQMLLAATQEAASGSPAYVDPIDLEGTTYTDTVAAPYGLAARTDVYVNTNGVIQVLRRVESDFSGNWYTPTTAGVGTGKYVRCTVNSGSLFAGTATGSWLELTTNRNWFVIRGSDPANAGTAEANITIEISSDASGSPVECDGTYTIKAVNPF